MRVHPDPALRFEGIYTPIVTPCTDDFEINWQALEDIVEFLVSSGVHGLISGGSTGENYAQTVEERLEVARFCLRTCSRPRSPDRWNGGHADGGVGCVGIRGARELGADGMFAGKSTVCRSDRKGERP